MISTNGLRALLAFGLLGCATTPAADLSRVEQLGRVSLSRPLFEGAVEKDMAVDAQTILSAPLTADSAVRLALLNNRELRATLRSLGIARGELVQAGLLPNPEIEVDLTSPAGGDGPLQKELSVELDLTHALLTGMREDVAEAELEAERYEAAGEVIALVYRTRVAFYAYQTAKQRHAVAQRMLEPWAAGREAAQALFEAGNWSELELASQDVDYEDARATAAELEVEMVERREDLHVLLGIDRDAAAWTIADAMPSVPEHLDVPEDVERRALDASLTLQETRRRLDAVAHRAGLARTEGWLPDVAVIAHAGQEERAWEYGGGLSFTVPIFDRKQGRVGAYEAQLAGLTERYYAQAVSLRSEARRVRQLVQSAFARAKQYRDVIVPARTRVMQQTLLHYNAMQLGVFQLLAARRGQLDAELAYAAALRDYWSAEAALEALLKGRAVTSVRATDTAMSTERSAEGAH